MEKPPGAGREEATRKLRLERCAWLANRRREERLPRRRAECGLAPAAESAPRRASSPPARAAKDSIAFASLLGSPPLSVPPLCVGAAERRPARTWTGLLLEGGRSAGWGGATIMLDFVIFAVTFLLILVGAVLYLCPVNKRGVSHGGGWVRKANQRALSLPRTRCNAILGNFTRK